MQQQGREQYWYSLAAYSRVAELVQSGVSSVNYYRDRDMGSVCWWIEWKR